MFSHLSEQKQLSLVGFLFARVCVCAQGMCQGVFMGTAAELVSSGWARKARFLYRLHILTDFYLQFAGKGSLKLVLTVQ